MTRRVRWLREAVDDLIGHAEYVARDSARSARRLAERVRQVGEDLAVFAIGRPGKLAGTYERVMVDVPYTIIYAISQDEDEEIVSILRVMHQAQQWPPDAEL